MTDFEEMLKKNQQENKPIGNKEDFFKELEEHIEGTKKPVREEPKPEEDEEEPDYQEDDMDGLEDDLEGERRKLTYKERVEQRKRRQFAWKEKKKREREARQQERVRKYEEHGLDTRPNRNLPDEQQEEPEPKMKKHIRWRREKEERQEPKETRRTIRPERKDTKKWTSYKAITMMVAFAVVFLMFMYSYVPSGSEQQKTTFDIMILLGMTLFLPVGMLVGWGVLDPFMRCRVLRRMTRKNLGVVCFVSKGKRIIAHVKNFDDSLIWVKNKCWAIRRNKIYEIDKFGEKIGEGENIEPEDLVIMTETVPMIFFDVDNMMPLSLHETNIEEVAPDELGPALKGWVDNQQAKLLFMKRTMEMFYMIIMIVTIGCLFLTYQNYNKLDDMTKQLSAIQAKLASLTPAVPSTPAGIIAFLGF